MTKDIDRFLSKIKKVDNCWLWTKPLHHTGYGQFKLGNKNTTAHNCSHVLFIGPVPKGKEVCHKDWICPHKHCVNPEHLYAGTKSENMQDRINAGNNPNLKKTHCKRGHKFTKENTYIVKKTGARQCKKCNKARSLK